MSGSRTARCCCGACTIEVKGEPLLNALCHCSSCKQRTGTAFGWSVYFADADVVATTGKTNVYARDGQAGYRRHFCAHCGTTLWWKSFGFMPNDTGIAGGCFGGDALPQPNLSATDGGRCAWVDLPATIFKVPLAIHFVLVLFLFCSLWWRMLRQPWRGA